MFSGKQVIVLGAAKSGISSARVLANFGAEVVLTDITPLHEMPDADRIALQSMDIRLVTGSHPIALLDRADLIVKNPGISPEIEFLREAQTRGIRWISELELAWLVTQAEIVAITGTNGKTTTTALTGEIFRRGNRPVAVGGNIGVPLTGLSFGKGSEWLLVVESSSFQLEDCYQLRPGVAVYTNISPDHLDRHKSLANYIGAKLRLVQNQTPADYCIVNLDDAALGKLDFGQGQRIGYSLVRQERADCYIHDGWFCWRGTKLAPVDSLRILGNHNRQNALAAIAAAMVMEIDPQAVREGLESFAGVEHRLEYVGEHGQVKFYNDSKATNPESTSTALNAFSQQVILLAGGSDKGADFALLAPLFREKVRQVYTFGAVGEKIRQQLAESGFTAATPAQDLDEAFTLAVQEAARGDIVLLSPACASYDQYHNFEERGRHFKALVEALGG